MVYSPHKICHHTVINSSPESIYIEDNLNLEDISMKAAFLEVHSFFLILRAEIKTVGGLENRCVKKRIAKLYVQGLRSGEMHVCALCVPVFVLLSSNNVPSFP